MQNSPRQAFALGLAGAVAGAAAGYFVFFWIAHQGYYMLALPAASLGLGAGLCARGRSVVLATVCCVAGVALGLFTEWRFAPFSADPGFGYFLAHIAALKPITLVMLALGAFFSYRFALGFGSRSRAGDDRNA